MERKPWWKERVLGGMTSYWIYQFVGNLSPAELRERPLWQAGAGRRDDAEPVLREFMAKDDQEREGKRWSYYRDLGTTRLIVADVRTGRCLDEGERKIVDDDEWDWIVERATEGEFDHLLHRHVRPVPAGARPSTTSRPGTSGSATAGGERRRPSLGEKMRQELDFDHWGAFAESFHRLTGLIEEVGAGEHGKPPATIGVLSGDVHHAYLADVAFRAGRRRSQPSSTRRVCSPYRNALDTGERRVIQLGALPARGRA